MDNFYIRITSEGEESLRSAMTLAFRHHAATHYAVRAATEGTPSGKPHRLVFLSCYTEAPKDAVPLPFKLDAAGAADFARRWLDEAPYGREPDHDGDNGRGWTLYCEGWSMVDGEHQAFVAVAPTWAMHGK